MKHAVKRVLVLLPIFLLGPVALAASSLKPGYTELNVELPREARLLAGRGELSPVAHALVTIATPANFDAAREWPVLVINATSDPNYNSSRRLLANYADAGLGAGWIMVAADPLEDVPVEKDDVALRVALNTVALAALELKLPSARKSPLAFGGFSGGAKYSGWLAASFARQGRSIAGIYLAGINNDAVISSARHFKVLDAEYRRIPIFLQYGDDDAISTPADHRNLYDELLRVGFRNVRIESFKGAHDVEPALLRKALSWFREFAPSPATSR